ncbi:MAG: rhodanese-like domain-containing protein [Nitriliruptorales bacterium]|nr:rhodanese-like domain-containing protein [Nitriliruptorales bacterium]
MKPARLTVRFRVADPPADLQPAIGVFHRFIQKGQVEGQILDVADYRHVPRGPGVLLIGHDVDYGLNFDTLTLVRKRSGHYPAATQLRDLLRMGLGAMQAIGYDGALNIDFDRSRFTVAAVDRRLGSTDEVEDALRTAIEPAVTELYGADASISPIEIDDPRRVPELLVEADAEVAATVLEQLGGWQPPGQSPWDITVEDLVALRENGQDFVLLDVREDHERDIVHLGGEHIPLADLDERVDELDHATQTIAYCRAGLRAPKAVEQLRRAGFPDVRHLNGGLMAWIDRIDPSLPRY